MPCRCWALNPGPLKDQTVLLITEQNWWDSKMAQWIKVLATKPDGLSSVPKRNDSCKLSSDGRTCPAYICTQTQRQRKKYNAMHFQRIGSGSSLLNSNNFASNGIEMFLFVFSSIC